MMLSFQDKIKPVTTTSNLSFASKIKPVAVDTPTTEQANVLFPARMGENPLIAGAKAVGNLPSSAFGVAKGLFEAVKSPVETIENIASIPIGAGESLARKITGDTTTPTLGAEEKFNAFTSMLKDRYGSLENLQKTATEDPFGFGADILTVLEGGAGTLGNTGQLNRAIGTFGKTAIAPMTKTISKGADMTRGLSKFGVSQATGLNPETITKLVKDPGAFRNLNPELRAETANKVKSALDARSKELSSTGKGYDVIRQTPSTVVIPKETIPTVLNKYGVKLDEVNKIITTPESRPLSPTDRVALQNFIDNYGSESVLSNNAFLNTREALTNLSKYEQGKTNLPTQIARDLRSEYDKLGKAQIKGLNELDTAYAPERQLISQLKKDILAPDGTLKDGAMSKIANLTGKGKEKVLERIKQVVPDIEERVSLVKAVEDIERSMGLKVGTYTRAGIGLTALASGNVPAIIGAIISQPSIAVPLLKGAGYVGQKAVPILSRLKTIIDNINIKIPPSVLQIPKVNEGQKQSEEGLFGDRITF